MTPSNINIDEFITFFRENADANINQAFIQHYMGTTRHHYGVSTSDVRAFVRAWAKQHSPTLTYEDWLTTLDMLYHGESFQERTVTGMLLAQFSKFRRRLAVEDLERLNVWLGQLVGWGEVDNTCQASFTAADLFAHWDGWLTWLRRWAVDDNINKRRASLVLLVKPLRENPDMRLLEIGLEQVDRLKAERDKLIIKAVSWVLRDAIKLHPTELAVYFEANEETLPALAVREVRNKLKTGKK